MSPESTSPPTCDAAPARPLTMHEKPHFDRLIKVGVPVEAAMREARRITLMNDIAVACSVDGLRNLLLRLTEEVFAK